MTRIILTGLALLTAFLGLSQTESKTLTIDIRGRDCKGGSGLCSVNSTSTINRTGMQKFNYIKITSTDLIFEVAISDLTKEEQIALFGKTYSTDTSTENSTFIQEEDYIFELNTLLYLELDPAYRLLKKGTYPLRFRDEKVQVLLSLSPYK